MWSSNTGQVIVEEFMYESRASVQFLHSFMTNQIEIHKYEELKASIFQAADMFVDGLFQQI